MRWFQDKPKELTEHDFEREADFIRFEWRLINGVWINIYREFEEVNGVIRFKESNKLS